MKTEAAKFTSSLRPSSVLPVKVSQKELEEKLKSGRFDTSPQWSAFRRKPKS